MGLAPNFATVFVGDSISCEVPDPIFPTARQRAKIAQLASHIPEIIQRFDQILTVLYFTRCRLRYFQGERFPVLREMKCAS